MVLYKTFKTKCYFVLASICGNVLIVGYIKQLKVCYGPKKMSHKAVELKRACTELQQVMVKTCWLQGSRRSADW